MLGRVYGERMGDIREAIQQIISDSMATVMGEPLGFTLVLLWLGLMFIVGVITSMRWTGQQLRRLFTRRKPISHWANVPKPPGNVPSVAQNVTPRPDPFPLRLDSGPRDWTP